MPIIHKNVIIPYSAAQMYGLVNDIEKYPEFLPWCKTSEIINRTEDEICASLTLAKSGMQKTFTTCNRLQSNKMVQVRLINGPFKQLQGFWQFDALSDSSCRIVFNLEFEFNNKLIALAFGSVFNQVSQTLVDAFTQRAVQLYG
jgi:ribosome-associated toxin RatA of RatAB toxin-antitoxin module